MLFKSVMKVLTTTYVKSVYFFGKEYIDGGHESTELTFYACLAEIALCTRGGT